jgi:hypothetical protein
VFFNASGSTLTIIDNTNSGVVYGIVYNAQGSKTIINGGTFNPRTTGEDYVLLNSSGVLEINGGTVNGGTHYAINSYGDNNKVVINDGTVNGIFGCVSVSGVDCSAEISGGAFEMKAEEGKSYHIVYFSNGDFTINGGSFTKSGVDLSPVGGGGVCAINGAKLTINGGTFKH